LFFLLQDLERQCDEMIKRLARELKAYPNELIGVAFHAAKRY